MREISDASPRVDIGAGGAQHPQPAGDAVLSNECSGRGRVWRRVAKLESIAVDFPDLWPAELRGPIANCRGRNCHRLFYSCRETKGLAMPEDAQGAFDFFVGTNWTKEQSAGLAANIEAESNFNPQAVGDRGTAFGLCQWHPDRQRNFQQQFGKNIRNSTFQEQLQFVNFELRQGTERRAGTMLSQAQTAEDAGEIVCSQYERPEDPDGHVRKHRGERAEELLGVLGN